MLVIVSSDLSRCHRVFLFRSHLKDSVSMWSFALGKKVVIATIVSKCERTLSCSAARHYWSGHLKILVTAVLAAIVGGDRLVKQDNNSSKQCWKWRKQGGRKSGTFCRLFGRCRNRPSRGEETRGHSGDGSPCWSRWLSSATLLGLGCWLLLPTAPVEWRIMRAYKSLKKQNKKTS